MEPSSEVEALVPTSQVAEVGDSVSDYTQLPGGGDYLYEGSQTFYSGLLCGRWKQNPDKSFTRMQ